MLIVSEFHDYYDTAIAHGVDKTVVYRREHKVIGKDPSYPQIITDVKRRNWHSRTFVVGFAGNLYPGVWIERAAGSDDQVFYSLDDFERWLADVGAEVREDKWFWRGSTDLLHSQVRRNHFDAAKHKGLLKIFTDHRTPIFLWRRDQVVINPTLKEWKFQKVKDPFTAFQDIYMFISGVLGVDARETVQISDKDLASKRGHDGKYSFRKYPGGGRWR